MAGRPLTAPPRIGVLALQGAFREHRRHLEALGASVHEVRLAVDLQGLDGLILPGGESTTMARLLGEYGLWEPLEAFHRGGGALWGTCAGAILLASRVLGGPPQHGGVQRSLGLLDVTVQRNAFGRQVDSFATPLDITGLTSPFEAVFIRAPAFTQMGPEVQVLASFQNQAVMVRQGQVLASAFHPELTADGRLHAAFLQSMVLKQTPVAMI